MALSVQPRGCDTAAEHSAGDAGCSRRGRGRHMGGGDATSITWDNLHDVTAYCPRASPCPDVTQLCHHATPALRSGGRGGGGCVLSLSFSLYRSMVLEGWPWRGEAAGSLYGEKRIA